MAQPSETPPAETPASDNAATPADPATPATPADPATGTAATPATPATAATPAAKQDELAPDAAAPTEDEGKAKAEKKKGAKSKGDKEQKLNPRLSVGAAGAGAKRGNAPEVKVWIQNDDVDFTSVRAC